MSRVPDSRNDIIGLPWHSDSGSNATNQPKVNDILTKLDIENKIKEGAENLLEVFDSRKIKDEGRLLLRKQVESQLDATNAKIQLLQLQLGDFGLYENSRGASPAGYSAASDGEESLGPGQESPTWSLGDILQSLESSRQSPEFLIERANDLVSLLQRHALLKYDLAMAQVGDKIRILLLHKQPEVIAAGYRVVRTALTDVESIRTIRSLQIDYIIIKSLAKESKAQIERVQAVRLIRSFMDVASGVGEISPGVIRALVAIAEHSEDKLRNIAIETLAEIFVKSPHKVATCGGIRVLLQCIVDGPYELSGPTAMAVIYVLESPANRNLLRNGRDLDYLISAFTENQIRGHVNTEKLRNSAKVFSSIVRTWSGLIALSSNDCFTFKSLVECLTVPVPSLRDVLLDLFLSILCIKPLSWSSSFLAGRRLTTFGRIPDLELEMANLAAASTTSLNGALNGGTEKRPSLDSYQCRFVDHFTSLLLVLFVNCNLVEALLNIMQDNTDVGNTRKATLLLGEILSMASRLSPPAVLKRISILPGLFEAAMDTQSENTAASLTAIFQVDKITRNLHRGRSGPPKDGQGPSRTKAVRVKMGVQIDDASFKHLVMETQVLNTKTYTKWNWDALSELIQGPLLNPKRLDEAIKTPKFMKRLLSFYRPFKYRFSSIKRTKPNHKYVEVGQSLFMTLLYNSEGVRYLMENKLLRQIAECLAQLDPMSGITSTEPLFSSQRLKNTLSHGYFMLLGTLSSDPNGIAMMEKWRMFNMFYHLSELKGREDLITSFISSMDYRLIGHPRIIMSKTLTTGQKDVRIFATKYLRNLINSEPETQKWAVGLLATQLFDPDVEVCRLAVEVLESFCSVSENLEHFVKIKPSLDHLGDIATPLLLRFLSTSRGFQYLKDLDYVNNEMDNWVHGLNDAFVIQMDEYLEKANNTWNRKHDDSALRLTTLGVSDVRPPRHFFGELTLTEEGCQLLQAKGHFETFSEYIEDNKGAKFDSDQIVKLRGCIWAVGYAGSNVLGAAFLEESGVVENLIEIFDKSEVIALRGTAFFALGLISRTYEGIEILDEFGWESMRDTMGEPYGICVPRSLYAKGSPGLQQTNASSFKDVNGASLANGRLSPKPAVAQEPESPAEDVEFPPVHSESTRRRIISALSDLSNQILANDAAKQLIKLQARDKSRFHNVELFHEAMKLLETYHYRLPVRRFIFELFDSSALLERMARKQKELRRARHLSDTTKSSSNPQIAAA